MSKQMQNLNNKKILNSKGAISVIVALSVLMIILTIGLGVSYITSSELAISGDARESTKAYYAAETGMEEAMYEWKGGNGAQPTAQTCNPPNYTAWTTVVGTDIKYCLDITQTGDYTTITAIKSIGEFGSVRRSVKISF